MWNDATLVIIICEGYCIVLFIRRTETMSIQAVYFHDFVSTTYKCVVRIHIIIILHHSKCNTYKLLSSNNIIDDFMRLDASIQGLHSFFSLSTYVVHIIIQFYASLQRLFKPNNHNIIIIILGTFRLRPEYSVILVPFLRVVHNYIADHNYTNYSSRKINASSKCRIFGFHLLIMTSPTI